MSEIKLGDEVKDLVTGFEGIVTQYYTTMHACDSVSVQPKVNDDGKVPKSHSFDITRLKILGKCDVPVIEQEKQSVFIGDKVKCKISDVEGYAFMVSLHLSGCRIVALAPKKDKYNKVELQWINEGQLEVQKEEKIETKSTNKGGSMPKISSWND